MKKSNDNESLSDITDKRKQAGFTTELTAMLHAQQEMVAYSHHFSSSSIWITYYFGG